MNNIHLVPHTHWDREWYFTAKDSYVLITESFKRVVDDLETNNTVYILDAQSSILEDFINFVPSYRERTIKLIESGRLIVGPWYTQTDCNYVGAESIIQNLKLGKELAAKYGDKSDIAYLPDTFGFNMQMPSILKACSIEKTVIRRGLDYEYHKTGPYFNWKAENGDEVKAVHLYKGYGELGHVSVEKKDKLDNYISTIKKHTHDNTKNFICLCGGDQTEINTEHTAIINTLNTMDNGENEYLDSSLVKFFETLKDEDYDLYKGDLRLGRYDRVHRSIGSSRYDIKTQNYELENYIFKVINPLIAIATNYNIHIEKELVNYCIKKLAENQAHDSMGGCITDEVYDDIIYRYKEVKEILDGIKNVISYRMHEILGLNENQIIIFNTSGMSTRIEKTIKVLSYDDSISLDIESTIVDVTKVSDFSEQGYHNIFEVLISGDVPTMGFKVINFGQSEEVLENIDVDEISSGKLLLKNINNQLVVEYDGNPIKDFITLYDRGNDGDTYDYSPLRNDEEIITNKCESIKFVKQSNQFKVFLQYQIELPVDLDNRITKKEMDMLNVDIELTLRNDEHIVAEITVDNNVYSHRLRVGIATGITSEEHIKSVPFTSVNDADTELVIDNFEEQGFVEENLDLKVLDNVIAKKCKDYGVAVKSHGLKEYQVVEDKFLITLFATTSEFGKGDLLSRPGRASGDTQRVGHKMISTPKAEYIGVNKFKLEISFAKEIDEKYISNFIDKSNTELVSFQKQLVDKFINRLDNKLFDLKQTVIEDKEFSLLTSKLPIQNIEVFSDGYLVRVENPCDLQKITNDYFSGCKIIEQTDVFGNKIEIDTYTVFEKTCSTFYIKGELC